jgi:hypothetical protein
LYKCVVVPNRRNGDYLSIQLNPALLQLLRRQGRRLEPPFNLEFTTPCQRLVGGVTLNGRKYKQGDRYFTNISCVHAH